MKLDPPTPIELPPKGFACEDPGYQAPAEDGSWQVQVKVAPDSKRLQLLDPFRAQRGELNGPQAAHQSQGQVHDRPHFDGRSVAPVPRSPRQHCEQHADGRHQLRPTTNRTKVKNQLTGEYGEVPATARAYKAEASAASWSATTTTAKAPAASTRPCSRATSV